MNEIIFVNKHGKVNAKSLYEFIGAGKSNYARWCKTNIENNPYAAENIDFTPFVIHDERNPNPTKDYELTIEFAKKLCMVSKTERGEQARDYFIAIEKQFKQERQDLSELSPQLQLLINMELKQKEQEKQITELRLVTSQTKEEIQGIREVISLSVNNWRLKIKGVMNSIAGKIGGRDEFGENRKMITVQSYELLDKRLGVNLKRRLTELRKRVALNGATKTKLNDLNYLDVIDEDKKLVEGYLAIVKELAIKYGVSVTEEGVAQ